MIKFGTDGIRGLYPSYINEDVCYRIGKAINFVSKVIIGYDTRESSFSLAKALYKGLKENNIEVVVLGVSSSPKTFFLSKLDECLAIEITASHNPYFYNGLKFVYKGYKINSLMKKQILLNYDETKKYLENSVNFEIINDYRYENYLSKIVDENKYKILFDLDHGALANMDISKLVNNTFIINENYDGKDINQKVGALYPNFLQKKLIELNYDFGFCFDGDADRVIMVDKENIYDGDDLLYFLADFLKQKEIVFTYMSNLALKHKLEDLNINSLICDVGDENVTKVLLEEHLLLGGEKAGHIIYTPHLASGDGLFIALLIIRLINEKEIDISSYLKEFKKYYYEEINVSSKNIDEAKINLIRELIELISDESRLILRKSGTEDKYRILVESKFEKKFILLKKYISLIIGGNNESNNT